MPLTVSVNRMVNGKTVQTVCTLAKGVWKCDGDPKFLTIIRDVSLPSGYYPDYDFALAQKIASAYAGKVQDTRKLKTIVPDGDVLFGDDVQAGGPGSGCRGENCGRPSTGVSKSERPRTLAENQVWNLPRGYSLDKVKTFHERESWDHETNWHHRAYGAVMVNNEGEFLLRSPRGFFDGYVWTWPKGKMADENEHSAETAMREVEEETGHKGRIFDALPGAWDSFSSVSHFYLMRPDTYDRSQMDKETYSTRWADYETAKSLLSKTVNKEGRSRDLAVLEKAHNYLNKHYAFKVNGAGIAAGGPGSGCHGPNCGRPPGTGAEEKPKKGETASQYLNKTGWAKTAQQGGPGSKEHMITTWEHPTHGTLKINHHLQKFEHYEKSGELTKKSPMGKFGHGLFHEHMSKITAPKLTVTPPPVAPPIPVTPPPVPQWKPEPVKTEEPLGSKPPNNLPSEVHDKEGTSWVWHPPTGGWKSNEPGVSVLSPLMVTQSLKEGFLQPTTPVSKAEEPTPAKAEPGTQPHPSTFGNPPEGTTAVMYSPNYDKVYMWEPTAGKWLGGIDTTGHYNTAYMKSHAVPFTGQPVYQQPPSGLPSAVYKPDGSLYIWHKPVDSYVGQYGTLLKPEAVKEGLDKGTFKDYTKAGSVSEATPKAAEPAPTPKIETPAKVEETGGVHPTKIGNPPEGMHSIMYNTATHTVYQWATDKQHYVSTKTGMELPTSYIAKKATPFDQAAQQDFKNLATKSTHPPAGLPNVLVGKNVMGETQLYAWNSKQKNYVTQDGKSIPSALMKNGYKDGALKDYSRLMEPPKKAGLWPEETKAPKAPEPKPAVAKQTETADILKEKGTQQQPETSKEFSFKQDAKSLGGAHDKYIFTDKQGKDWLFKPAETLGGQKAQLMAYADETASKIAQALRPGFSVAAKAVTLEVPGKGEVFGSIQKMIPAEVLRGPGGKYKDFVGRDFNTQPLNDWEVKGLQQEQVVDWLLSNHDAHAGQFLRVSSQYENGRGLIGIDKTQAFKYFPNDKLSMDYHPNASYGEEPPYYNVMWDAVKNGKLGFNPDDSLETIKRAEAISDIEYRKMLMPYTASRFTNTEDANKFLDQALARKHSLRSDFEQFYSQILGHKYKFEPQYEPGAAVTVNIVHGKKPEYLPEDDKEPRPSSKTLYTQKIPELYEKYKKLGKDDLSESVIANWQVRYNSFAHLPEAQRLVESAKGMGLYPELAAQVGVKPKELNRVRDSIDNWKSTTHSKGAAWIRAAAQEMVTDTCCKSKFSAAMELEYHVTQHKLKQMYPEDQSLTLYRGLTDEVAVAFKKAIKQGDKIEFHTMGAEGWSDSHSTGQGFGSGGVVLKSQIPFEHIVTSWKTNPGAFTNYLSEKESFVAPPYKKQWLSKMQIMTGAADKGPKWMGDEKVTVIDTTDQSHRAFPPAVEGSEPAEVIEVVLLDQFGQPLVKNRKF